MRNTEFGNNYDLVEMCGIAKAWHNPNRVNQSCDPYQEMNFAWRRYGMMARGILVRELRRSLTPTTTTE